MSGDIGANGETVTPVAELENIGSLIRRANPAALEEWEDDEESFTTAKDSAKAKDDAVHNQSAIAKPLPGISQPPKACRRGVSHASKAALLTDICRTDRSISTNTLASTLSVMLSLPHVCHRGCHVSLYICHTQPLGDCIGLHRPLTLSLTLLLSLLIHHLGCAAAALCRRWIDPANDRAKFGMGGKEAQFPYYPSRVECK